MLVTIFSHSPAIEEKQTQIIIWYSSKKSSKYLINCTISANGVVTDTLIIGLVNFYGKSFSTTMT